MRDFTALSYTSTCETPAFLYTIKPKKGFPFLTESICIGRYRGALPLGLEVNTFS